MKKSSITRILHIALFFLSIASVIYPAIINGFPLVYSDSGTYIWAVPGHYLPVDRPLGYSLFIKLFSFSITLWIVVIVQALMLFYLVYLLFKDVIKIKNALLWSYATIIVLSFITGMSNYASQLMPDIFVGMVLLSMSIVLFRAQQDKISIIILTVIFLFSAISHFSHILIATLIFFVVMGIKLFHASGKVFISKGVKVIIVWIILAWLVIPLLNLRFGGKFTLAKTHSVSLTGRLLEAGIIKDYLNEYCGSERHSLCHYADSLPKDIVAFMWDNASPLYQGDCMKTGWGDCWVEKDHEYGQLIKDVLSKPKYINRVVQMSVKGTLKQLPDFNIGMLTSMKENSPPYSALKDYYKKDLNGYISAKQFKTDLYFPIESKIQRIVVYASIILLLILYLIKRTRSMFTPQFGLFMIIIVSGIVFNAIICSTLSSPVDRYEARIIWLMPLLVLVSLPLWHRILSLRNRASLRS